MMIGMYWDVVEVSSGENWTLFVRFADGLSGSIRFLPGFFKGVFEPIREPSRFAEVFVDRGTVAWPGDVDLAPDALYERLSREQDCVLTGEPADALA